MAAVGSQVSVRMAGSRPAFLARSAMEPASRRATSSDRISWRKSACGMLCWRARVRRSGKVAVSLPSLRARRVAVRSGPSGSVSDDMGVFLPGEGGWAGRGQGRLIGGPCPRSGLGLAAAGAGPGGLSRWPGGGPGGGRAVAGAGSGGGTGLVSEMALVVALEVELVFGVLGAGAPGVGQGLDGVQLGGAGGGRRVAFTGGVGADVVVFGAGVGFGLPGPADLGAGVVAGLGGSAQRGFPGGVRGAGLGEGLGDGGVGFPADLDDLGAGVVAGGLRAGIRGVGVGAGGVGGFQRGLGVVPG